MPHSLNPSRTPLSRKRTEKLSPEPGEGNPPESKKLRRVAPAQSFADVLKEMPVNGERSFFLLDNFPLNFLTLLQGLLPRSTPTSTTYSKKPWVGAIISRSLPFPSYPFTSLSIRRYPTTSKRLTSRSDLRRNRGAFTPRHRAYSSTKSISQTGVRVLVHVTFDSPLSRMLGPVRRVDTFLQNYKVSRSCSRSSLTSGAHIHRRLDQGDDLDGDPPLEIRAGRRPRKAFSQPSRILCSVRSLHLRLIAYLHSVLTSDTGRRI